MPRDERENEQQPGRDDSSSNSGNQQGQDAQRDQGSSTRQTITTDRGANANENSERKALTEKFRKEKEE